MTSATLTHTVALMEGDGIGPEIVAAALPVLEAAADAAGARLAWQRLDAGTRAFARSGASVPPDVLEACRGARAMLKGPAGLPGVRHPDGTEAGTVAGPLRKAFTLFANVRPVRRIPGIPALAPEGTDYVIVRENTEGAYATRGGGEVTDEAAEDRIRITREGTERVTRLAFDLARRRAAGPGASSAPEGGPRVTCCDKANVLRSFAFFRRVAGEVAAEYPDVTFDTAYADAVAAAIVDRSRRFDVLLAENLIGDILSDVAAATIGGLGFCPAANLGERHGLFEPVHGSAPDIAGTDRANPAAMILAGAMMLEWLGIAGAADGVRRAVDRAAVTGALGLQPNGTVASTRAAGRAVLAALS
ncbi:MAG TPA: isocitrate/isopropylmalate family dehydrogenase [bacterium]|nr:isocitrate/isopropylmalate family dehydrogenase [bacterium]